MGFLDSLSEFWNTIVSANPVSYIWSRYDFTGGLFGTVVVFLSALIAIKAGQMVFNFIKL